MKTYETEKHNIPEGATGYRKQGDYIEWFGGRDGCWRLIASTVPSMEMCNTSKPVKPIPQTNTETPEEKRVGWVNGDKCRYNDINWLFCGFHPANSLAIVANDDEPSSHQVITVDVNLLSKPETPQQREERERNESIHRMVDDFTEQDLDCNYRGKVAKVCAALYDAGYRKER